MTLAPTRAKPHEHDTQAEALFREARQRRRRIRLGVASVLAAVLLVAALVTTLNGSRTTVPLIPTNAASFARLVLNATRSAGRANVTVVVRNVDPGNPWSEDVSIGTIDFRRQSVSLTTVLHRSALFPSYSGYGEQFREFGNRVYFHDRPALCAGPNYTTHICDPHPHGASWQRPWWGSTLTGLYGPAISGPLDDAAVNIVKTPYGLTVLDALSGRVHQGGTSRVAGQTVRTYRATITLADLQTASGHVTGPGHEVPGVIVKSPSGATPPSSAIVVSVTMWVDSEHRLVQLQATQPFFMVNLVGGATSSTGATQFDLNYNTTPGEKATDYPYVQGYFRVTTTFDGYGVQSAPVPPPAAEVIRCPNGPGLGETNCVGVPKSVVTRVQACEALPRSEITARRACIRSLEGLMSLG